MLFLLLFVTTALWLYVELTKSSRRASSSSSSQANQLLAAPCSRYRPASLFSHAEANFFAELSARYQGRAWIFSKVRLADLAQPSVRAYTSEWHTAFNRISAKHVDFVLCRLDLAPLCVIELDDSSHARYSRQERDEFVDRVLEDVGLPIFHMPVRSTYSTTDFKSIDTLF